MAHVAEHIESSPSNIFVRFFDFLVSLGAVSYRARQLEALSAVSDEQLAKRGLKREDLVLKIIRGSRYI